MTNDQEFIVGIDLDSIVAALLKPWLDKYNRDYNDNLTVDQVKSWHLDQFVKPECGKKIYRYLKEDLYHDLEVLEGALEGVKAIKAMPGVKVVFVTAAPLGTADAKIKWTMKKFDVTKSDVITADQKDLVYLNLLIDDGPHNIKAYRERWPDAFIFTIAYPYNEEAADLCDMRLGGHGDTARAWRQFVQGVHWAKEAWEKGLA